MTGRAPLVSICIPTFQGARWIRGSITSALAQGHPSLEVVVSDDASTDETVAIASSLADPRLRILASDRRLGMAANWDRAVRASRGEYVLLLMQDDSLEPDAISTMAAVLDRHPGVGFVFAERTIQVEAMPDGEATLLLARLESVHRGLEPLDEVNDGARLFERMRVERFRANRIGEPSVVLIRRSALVRVGLFNTRLVQATDLELWLRVAASSDVGFVRRPLATFRVHPDAASTRNRLTDAAWMDRAWLLEGLLQDPGCGRALGRWTPLAIRAATAKAGLVLVIRRGGPGAGRLARQVGEYLRFLAARERPRLHETLDGPGPGGAGLP